eukprot:3628251-Rhodomonas_salina.1
MRAPTTVRTFVLTESPPHWVLHLLLHLLLLLCKNAPAPFALAPVSILVQDLLDEPCSPDPAADQLGLLW